ncbi:hypothetical protein CK203_051412 [Vitis vinifera]|uniref:Uncharacterized protein n=1 Tax=Vitis vinifera TaxID=29760 RepID=A0A438H1B4_VITVI|nr:hypothetical protein CK203_051412 [Vitis vinifera]
MAPLPGDRITPEESNGAVAGDGATLHLKKRWDEPNARDMGRMTSQPNAKGEMYILNDGIDMKAKIAAMARRLEELEMNQMQECPTIPARGKCLVIATPTIPIGRTIQNSLGNHSHLSKATCSSIPQASSLEQAMVNLSKFVGDFVGAQKAIKCSTQSKN